MRGTGVHPAKTGTLGLRDISLKEAPNHNPPGYPAVREECVDSFNREENIYSMSSSGVTRCKDYYSFTVDGPS